MISSNRSKLCGRKRVTTAGSRRSLLRPAVTTTESARVCVCVCKAVGAGRRTCGERLGPVAAHEHECVPAGAETLAPEPRTNDETGVAWPRGKCSRLSRSGGVGVACSVRCMPHCEFHPRTTSEGPGKTMAHARAVFAPAAPAVAACSEFIGVRGAEAERLDSMGRYNMVPRMSLGGRLVYGRDYYSGRPGRFLFNSPNTASWYIGPSWGSYASAVLRLGSTGA
jgi:hypothetical protein